MNDYLINYDYKVSQSLLSAQSFEYNGCEVSMTKNVNGNVYVNLTEFAKLFPNKNLTHIINSLEINEYCKALSKVQNCSFVDLLIVKKGAPNLGGGTWAHQKVALRVAQKLSPEFAVWVDTKIEELLNSGVTTVTNDDEVIAKAMDVLNKRLAESRKRQQELELQNEQNREVIELKNEKIKILTPKGQSYDTIMSSQGLVTTNMIAAFIGISAIKLNQLLCSWDVQYKQSGTYFLMSNYRDKGYTKHVPYPYDDNGVTKTKQHMYWTEIGRKFVIDLYSLKCAA